MVVCLCRGVSEAEIVQTIDGGATSIEEIAEACGAGSDCRVCCDALYDLIRRRHPGAPHCSTRASCLARSGT